MDLSRLCQNRTPMDVRCVPMDDRTGREVLVVIAKMTWRVGPNGAATIARPIAPVRIFDVPRSDARYASLRHASDAVDEKPGTDVLLLGTAYPSRPDATKQSVSLRVETGRTSLHKVLTVHGPRVWQQAMVGLTPGPSGKMGPTPLVYELAFGGVDATDPEVPVSDYRNLSGTGFHERRAGLVGRPAPVIEDPRLPLSSRAPAPAGFGPIPQHWAPRSERAGTHDEAWRRERAPLRPLDFDPRHNSCAPDDQWLETPLVGDEAVEVLGATPEGAWRFRLPRYAPMFHSTVRGRSFEHPTHLDTFCIDADARTVELVWRVRVALPRKTEHLEKVVIFGSEPLPHHIVAQLAASVFGEGSTAEAS
ncbi:DUF2169 family type VI secretion system accessory protein [Chondromyces apiculatus]|uniref:DUF2169 domain-containing protein n=1 Tax=Chondromyces apiculatus DSM 436 TaxID=1192034 RepID=A0A017TCP0_9BACT|nr:DUF2169 domain-containing protein [Chondromyces apiculatus]EYF06406.1 Hypothetical protein CAP_1936 [Chondromyces apiculatus DSM 436]